MDETSDTEWQWFRRAIRDSLMRPRRFAASLTREHYGLAGVGVALLAGSALSLSVDTIVIASKGLDPLDFTGRLITNALFVGLRVAIVAAVTSAVLAVVLRVARRADHSMDLAFTAITFALTPLLVLPILAALLALVPESAAVVGLLAVLLLGRLLYGVFLNVRPLAPRVLAVAAGVIIVAGLAVTLADQVSRIGLTALAYQPFLAPERPVTPAIGTTVRGDGFELTVPPRWKQVSSGNAGEIARFETDNDSVVVMRAGGGAFATLDGYAESVGVPWRRGLENTRSSRSIFRNGSLVILDDTYTGTVDGRPELLRQFTALVGTRGLALLFRYIEPNEAQAQSESSAIAATWRVEGR